VGGGGGGRHQVAKEDRLNSRRIVRKDYLRMSGNDTLAEIFDREHADNSSGGVTNKQVTNVS
jgi:hypothetical protein